MYCAIRRLTDACRCKHESFCWKIKLWDDVNEFKKKQLVIFDTQNVKPYLEVMFNRLSNHRQWTGHYFVHNSIEELQTSGLDKFNKRQFYNFWKRHFTKWECIAMLILLCPCTSPSEGTGTSLCRLFYPISIPR